MLSSSARAYTDPDDYAASAQATTVMLTLAARGDFHAHRISIKLHHLWLQSFSERLPRVAHWANHPGRAVISFRTNLGQGCSRPVQKWGHPVLFDGEKLKTIFSDRTGRFPLARCRSLFPK